MTPHTGVPLAPLTTLRLGGPANELREYADEQELVQAIAAADARSEPVLVLGGGSNVVIADEGFPGTVLAVRTRGITVSADACSGATVEVAAGEPWCGLVSLAVDSGWTGVECLAGIPGSTGATPIQNVGAYGQEVSETVARVRAYDRRRGRVVTLAASECGFAYRTSRFKQDRDSYVVLSVVFQLPLGDWSAPIRYAELARALGVPLGARVELGVARDAVLDLRRLKGMVLDADDRDTWSAGSFFTNPILSSAAFAELSDLVARRWGDGVQPPAYPGDDDTVKTSAAWLIERAGFQRGHGDGPVRLSTRHTLALTHRGGGTTGDLIALARLIRDRVRSELGVVLEPEPVLVGVVL